MIRIFGPGLVGLAVLALWIYCIFDVIATDDSLARNLPKGLWLLLVIVLGPVGCIAWLVMGRPLYAGWRPGDTTARTVRPALGPEDDRAWPTSTHPAAAPPDPDAQRLAAWEADLRRREDELQRRHGEEPTGGDGSPQGS